jgi:hypothetical protein
MWVLDAIFEFFFGRHRSWTRLFLAIALAVLVGWLLRNWLG